MNREEFEQSATPLRARIVGVVITMSDSVDTSLDDDVAQETLMILWAIRDKLDCGIRLLAGRKSHPRR